MSLYFSILLLTERALISTCLPWMESVSNGILDESMCQAIVQLTIGSLVIGLIAFILEHNHLTQKIRHRQQVDSELRLREAHYRDLIQVLPDLIMRINRDGIHLEFLASPNFPLFGTSISTWVGTHLADQLPPDIAQQRLKAIQIALETRSIRMALT